MDELVRWLGKQLDEDERTARRATARQSGGGAWTYDGSDVQAESGLGVARRVVPVHGEHIAEHDPARALREIDAKRQVLTGYTKAVEAAEELGALRERLKASGQDVFMTEMERASAIHKRDVLHGVIQILALPYADRPGYREDWRP